MMKPFPVTWLRQCPNILTGLRLGLGLPFWLAADSGRWGVALAVLALAGLTDMLDGWIARRYGAETTLGRWLDPVADKVMVAVVCLALWGAGQVSLLFVVLMIGRDMVHLGAVLILRRWTFHPTPLGKAAVAVQYLFFAAVLLQAVAAWPMVNTVFWQWLVITVSLAATLDYGVRLLVSIMTTDRAATHP